jgi:hypothetical protein
MIQTIFIVPYRDRACHKHFFEKYMSYLMEDVDPSTYEIVFAHQKNELPFNRGGMKNIGFLYAKEKYPHYKDIVFVFHDIDTLPFKKGLLDFTLKENEIKHYYGFKYCLGGIMAIKGKDFERINGFPSFWNWGWEDTILYERAIASQMIVNRSQYFEFGDHSILHMIDKPTRDISLDVYNQYKKGMVVDGLSTLKHVRYTKNEMLDVEHFVGLYYPFDTSVRHYAVKKGKVELPTHLTQAPVRNRMMKY